MNYFMALVFLVFFGIHQPLLAETRIIGGVQCELYKKTFERHNFDYRDIDRDTLFWKGKVERAHFTVSVRRGIAGNAGSLMGDLTYTLDHFPNHPEALLVLAQHQASPGYNPKMRADRTDYYWPTTECYFQKAIYFAPDDPAVYLVMGVFYHQQKRFQEAEQAYLNSLSLDDVYPTTHYNLGLLYADLKRWDEAVLQAKRAYSLDYPLPGLKERLKATGRSMD